MERETKFARGRRIAARRAASSSVPPPPVCRSMTSMARATFSELAARRRGHHSRSAREENDVEGIGRLQLTDQVLQDFLRRIEWETTHRARHIDDEDVLARRNLAGGDSGRRLDGE